MILKNQIFKYEDLFDSKKCFTSLLLLEYFGSRYWHALKNIGLKKALAKRLRAIVSKINRKNSNIINKLINLLCTTHGFTFLVTKLSDSSSNEKWLRRKMNIISTDVHE